MKPQTLTIDSEALQDYLQTQVSMMNMCICNLAEKKLVSGTVTAKIKIALIEQKDEKTGEFYYRMELEPKVDVKVGGSASVKCKKESGLFMKRDERGMPVIASTQIDMEEFLQEGA